jgi:EmrB/QacA subfamily drug resistance transporter
MSIGCLDEAAGKTIDMREHPQHMYRPHNGDVQQAAEQTPQVISAADKPHQGQLTYETENTLAGRAGGRSLEQSDYRVIAIIIASALFMENLDATVLVTAIPAMARHFQVRAPEMSVALTAYLLALALFIPASGHAADRWGGRNVFRAAICIFMAGSLMCALAPNLIVLVISRFAQGLGGAMMVPVGRLVLMRTVSKRDLISASSWLLMPALIGQIAGPPIGGFIVTYFDWRWIFWVNMPIGAAGIWLIGHFIPDRRETVRRRFDLPGFVLSGVTLTTFLFGLEVAGRGAQMRLAGGLIALAIVFGALYLRHAARAIHPILDLSLLRVPTFRLALIGGSLTRITHGAQPFLLALMMQLAFGLKASESGLITLATSLGTFTMKGVAGHILRRFGFRTSLTVIGVLGACSYAVCGLFRPGWPFPLIFIVLVMSGFFMSFQFTAYNTIAYDEIEPARMSSATSFYSTFQQLTLSLGICIGASMLHLSMMLAGRVTPSFVEFSVAFWIVTGISLCSLFTNIRFDPNAGREMSGASWRGAP